jgi:hypothetical protein
MLNYARFENCFLDRNLFWGARCSMDFMDYNLGPHVHVGRLRTLTISMDRHLIVLGHYRCSTAASLAEICSSIPLSGSIYIWAAESGGKKYGRFFGFVVAFWTTTAWTSFVASTAQASTNFMLSQVIVFGTPYAETVQNGGIQFRAVVWIISELFLLVAVLSNFVARSFQDVFHQSIQYLY